MHDGTTPLILAARLAIEGMVEDLIHADADINIPDNSGKTALHWAASVNNVDAVNILLANNANKDAQDDKVNIYIFLLFIDIWNPYRITLLSVLTDVFQFLFSQKP